MSDERQERDDEWLSAWLDGELPVAEADELTRRLASEPALAERLAALRAMDRAAVAAFHDLEESPMPRRVLDMIGEHEEAAPRAGNVVPLRSASGAGRGLGRFFRLPVAVAASIALVAGIWLGALTGDGGAPDGAVYASRIAEGSALYAAFDTAASGDTVDLGGDRLAEPILTFRSDGGAWCRHLRITGGAAPADTLACRRDGAWQVELVSFGPASAADPEGPYGAASAGGTPAMRAAIDDLIGRRPPLDLVEEAGVIERGWPGGEPGAAETE